jgi:aspartyl-tRNA(Asn)/glutamyl-tRNA(Gln) amidotransferase subunit B
MANYLPTIGLEIHIELKTQRKMFCDCLNNSEEKQPNLNVCPVCLGHPGVLPKVNYEAVRSILKLGSALNCSLREVSKFDRKNYFYPDLPKGYQISQYDKPFCENGYLEIPFINKESEIYDFKKIKIRRIHLEEDTGKLIHADNKTFVDFNRAGVPLAELVTEPDIHSAEEAKKFCEELQLIIRYLGIANADMEKGEMRCEVNISLRKEGEEGLGTKVEIKNLNSFKAVADAIKYEIERQTALLEKGEKIVQETRGWDENTQKTVSQRRKEEAHDYRYFPEPDLKPINIKEQFDIEEIKREVPELPNEKRLRFFKEYGLRPNEIEELVYYFDLADYFEKVIMELDGLKLKEGKEREKRIKLAYNYLTTDLRALMSERLTKVKDLKITAAQFASLINFIDSDQISSAAAKAVLADIFETGANPETIIKEKNLFQISDVKEIEEVIKKVVAENPQPVSDFQKGKENALQFLVGQIMRETKGRFKPTVVQEELKKFLTKGE